MRDLDLSNLLSVSEAIAIVDAVPVFPRIVQVSLHESIGLTLGQDIYVDRDWPHFAKSLLDGFAVRSADTNSATPDAPVKLKIHSQSTPGAALATTLSPGQATPIMTGAPLPIGADAIVPVEETLEGFAHGETISITYHARPARGVAARASDARAGAIALPRGALITPAAAAVLASVGAVRFTVLAQPTATVLSTGNEIVPPQATPTSTQLRDANSIMLASLLKNLGCKRMESPANAGASGILPDDPTALVSAIRSGFQSDVLAISGGMSMGKFDYVPKILSDLGVEIKISKLKIRPGKPFIFGLHKTPSHTCHIFGLPGNPLSGYVCMLRLGARLIARLLGQSPEINLPQAALTQPIPKNGPRETYVPAVQLAGQVTPLPWTGSADLLALAKANVLIVRPENDSARAQGQPVEILICR